MNRALRQIFLSLVMLFLLSPIVVVGGVSLNAKKALYFPPQGISLAWYVELFTESAWLIPVENSLIIATLSSLTAVSIALPLAYFLFKTYPHLKAAEIKEGESVWDRLGIKL